MRQSLRVGRIAGVMVGVHWTVGVTVMLIAWLVGAALLPAEFPHQAAAVYWAVAIPAALLFAASLLAHELAHAVVARRNGLRVRSITLWMLGGVTELEGEAPTAAADLRIALAGPATSGLAAGVFAAAAAVAGYVSGASVLVGALAWLAVTNLLLAVFNLLPGAPLDGGRVLRALLWWRYGDRGRASAAATRAGGVVGAGIAVLGLAEVFAWHDIGGLWLMLIGWFVMTAASAEGRAVAAGAALAGLRVADVMTPDPDLAPGWMTVEDFIGQVVTRARLGVFPVVDLGGSLAGVVSAGLLARVPADDRTMLRVDQVMLAVPQAYQAAPTDPAAPLLTRPPLGGEVAAVVLDHGHVVGVVTTADITATVRRAQLARPSARRVPAIPQTDWETG